MAVVATAVVVVVALSVRPRAGCAVTAGAGAGAATGTAAGAAGGAAGAGAGAGAAGAGAATAGVTGVSGCVARRGGAETTGRSRVTTIRVCAGTGAILTAWVRCSAKGACDCGGAGARAARITSGPLPATLGSGAPGAPKTEAPGTLPRRCANAAAPATAVVSKTAVTTRPMPLMLRPPGAENITRKSYRRMGVRP